MAVCLAAKLDNLLVVKSAVLLVAYLAAHWAPLMAEKMAGK